MKNIKFKKIYSFILIILIIISVNLEVKSTEYNNKIYNIDIPAKYNVMEYDDGIEAEYFDENDKYYIISLNVQEDKSKYNCDENYLNKCISTINEQYEKSSFLLSSQIINKNGYNGIDVKYVINVGELTYWEYIEFKTDNYMYNIQILTTSSTYLQSQERKLIFDSFVINDNKKELPFKDVLENTWYYSAVKYTYENGMIKGTTNTTFDPELKLTRGMMVTILHRMEGLQKSTITNKFKDVESSKYYYEAVKWATEKGIVHGYDTGLFGPNDPIKRQDLAVIFRNYARYKKQNSVIKADLSIFSDYKNVSNYANDAMQWAVGRGVITGNSNTKTLNPLGTATRAEAASMLYKYCLKVK